MGFPVAEWCGEAIGDAGWWPLSRAFNPCLLESTAIALSSTAIIIMLLINRNSLRHASELIANHARDKGPVGMTGQEAGLVAGTGFIAFIHLFHAVAATWMGLPPFHITTHFIMLSVWITVSYIQMRSGKVHVPLDYRLLFGTMLVVYLASLETYWSLYRALDIFPLPYMRSTIWSLMLQSVVTLLLFVLDIRAHRSMAPRGYEALPSGPDAATDTTPADAATATAAGGGAGQDVEAGTGGKADASDQKAAVKTGPGAATPGAAAPGRSASLAAGEGPKEEHSWLALFADACIAVWPEDASLQIRAILAFTLLLSMRALNLLVPILYKKLVDSMTALQSTDSSAVWLLAHWLPAWVVLYLVAIFFQGGAGAGLVGAINNVRQVLWIPVGQDAYKRISLRIFRHILGLDLSFHLGRKTGEVTKQIDRGTNAMQNILSTIMFSIVPTCIDVLTASTYLAQALEPSIALTVFLTVGSYIPVTIIITEWRGNLRREMNRTDQIQSARVVDALVNYETVHYFDNLDHECGQYATAIADYQKAEFKAMASVNLLNAVQSGIMWIGISVGLLVCSAGVSRGELTVGDVVLFLSLMAQLYGPLNWFGSYYRTIQQYMIDMENLFQLLDRKSDVNDKPDAKALVLSTGSVEYDSVSFEYERGTSVLRHVSFSVPGGQTIAFVGATGSGKSTVTRLIFRFYDVTSGAIRIDGQDIRDVTKDSLRRAVGMVPQDTVLFNDTIMQNIRYGRLGATDEEVFAAAQAACIHEAITTRFPKGYDTVVGERGLRLSGGEKQRVAFARALLKNPAVLVLDEATSALDTLTERKIQAALATSRESRTTMIVAHRLSTIVDANIIVVMHLGQVVEQGSHAELLEKDGLYAELWNKQLTSGVNNGASMTDLASAAGNATQGSVASGGGASQAGGATASSGAAPSHSGHHGHH